MDFLDSVGDFAGDIYSGVTSLFGGAGGQSQAGPQPVPGQGAGLARQDPMMNLYQMAKRKEQARAQEFNQNSMQAQLYRNPAPPAPMPGQIPPRPPQMAQRPGGMQGRLQQEGLIGG